MAESSSTTSSGTSIAGLLGVAFVVLKLTGVITWSWWWVTAPFWGGLVIAVAIMAVIGVVALGAVGVATLLDNRTTRIRHKNRKRLR